MSALAFATKPADQRTDDVDLVAAVRAGDDRAFEQLFVRYQGRIAVYVRGMVRDRERTEDITQEVFIAALRRLRATETPIAFKPWVYEIAKNACIDVYRRSRNRSEVSLEDDEMLGPSLVAQGGAPDAVVDAKLAIDNLCGAFGGLSQAHHDILVMREFEDLSYREIGERMGMSRAAVESTLFRARRRLGEEYEELVSGERCLRVRAIVDAPSGRGVGTRDQRRMARHVAHCQPCRRHARLAGVDLDVVRAPVAPRIAALIPLPAFLRRRLDLDDGSQLLGHHGAGLQWSSKVVAVLDPATISGWPKAIATAATVAFAGIGAGAAVGEREAIGDAVSMARGARVAAALAQHQAAPERAPHRRTRPGSSGRGPARSGSSTSPSGRDSEDRGVKRPIAAKPISTEPAPAGSAGSGSGSEPGAGPTAAPIAAPDVGATLPAEGPPSVDATAGEISTARPPRERPPGSGLVIGPGTAGGGTDTSQPDTLGDVTSTVDDTIAQGGSPAADVGTDSPGTVGVTTATGGPVSDVVGGALGGALGGAGIGSS